MILAATTGVCIVSGIFVFGCLILIGVILLQKGRGAGLSGAFGGGGGQSAFGAKTGDVLTWVTVGLGVSLLTMVIILNWMFQPTRYDAAKSAATPPAMAVTPAAQTMPASLPATGLEATPPAPAASQPQVTTQGTAS